MDFKEVLIKQKEFFNTDQTKDINFRKAQLQKLKTLIQENESLFYEAIYKDFGKSKFDTYTTELSLLYKEINYFLKNLHKLAKPKSVTNNFANLPGSSKIYATPLGNILVIGAWNYPIQLSLLPVVGSLAAGNTCILKPSEVALNTSNCIAKLINENFDEHYFKVIEGGIEETTTILQLKFDKIFYTGSTSVGKIVYEAAAKNLTPVTLELGGKSPVIVTQTANIEVAVKRIVWGKFLNAGQTCVAPDYILVDDKITEKFINILIKQIETNNYHPKSEYYTRIINKKNFDRLINLIDQKKLIYGGKNSIEELYMEPSVMYPVSWEDDIMQQEIFGPILPILTYSNFGDALNEIQRHEKPLSAYLFSNNSEEMDLFTSQVSFGGGCINDVVMHLANEKFPFGGIGNSGMGNYHGKYSFKNFSHEKPVLKKANWGEPNIKYPPYSEQKLNIIKKII